VRKTRIYTEAASTWSADGGQILMTGDLDDRYRIYNIDLEPSGTLHPLTPADADAHGPALPLPSAKGSGDFLFVAGAPDPSERHVWRAFSDRPAVRLTQRPGTHRAWLAPDGRTIATIFSSDTEPPELWLRSISGDRRRQVTQGGTERLSSAQIAAPRYVRIPGPSGGTLHAKVWRPRVEPAPVLFGPVYVNTVRNRWSARWGLLVQLLVQRGYVVTQVDVRGSTGYGRDFREQFLEGWGDRDLDDLEASKAWFARQTWADATTTGIFGSSYGGLVGVYALLTRPGLFDAVVAGAPATDPRFFGSDDVAITRWPRRHRQALARRASNFAQGLTGHLMIIHGLRDDVVPFKTTVDLAEALMQARKDFDLVVAPGATHRWTGQRHHARYLLNKLLQHFDRHVPIRSH
ncbi:MAG: prolyl oligopeptidase family serine peptidase, partial [Myxococcota bacterium]